MVVVGIDLAGVETRPSGFCTLDPETLKVETKILYGDEEIIREVEVSGAEVVAIDAPLSIPKGRKSLSERSNIHLRECDRELLRLGIRFFPITLGPMRKLTERGIRLKEKLERRGFKVIEVYPGGAQDILGIPRKGRGLEKLLEGLRKLGLKGLRGDMTGDELDAVTSAYVGKLYIEGEYTALGDADEGVMIMPKVRKDYTLRE